MGNIPHSLSRYGCQVQFETMEGDSGLDVLSNDGILDIIPPSEYDPFEVRKFDFILRNTSCLL